jgi:hypothetical protein
MAQEVHCRTNYYAVAFGFQEIVMVLKFVGEFKDGFGYTSTENEIIITVQLVKL